VSARRTIKKSQLPAIIDNALERLHWAGGIRNAAMLLRGMGPEDAAFVRLSCVGIAQVTQAAIFSQMVGGKLPKVRSSLVLRRNVGGFEHKGTGVAMKDGSDYVFDWWPTLNPNNPLISAYAQWFVAGRTIEYRNFKGLP